MKKGKGCLISIIVVFILIIIIGALGNSPKDEKAKDNIPETKSESSVSKDIEKKDEKEKEDIKEDKKEDEDIVKSGQYQVGKDIPAGEYKVFSDSNNAYIEVSSDSSGGFDSILFNDNFKTFTYAKLDENQYLKLSNCYAIPVEKAKKFEDAEIKDGMYKVGVDIPAGEYNITASGNGYYEINNTPHDMMNIISNDNFTDNRIVTVQDGQYIKISNAIAKINN